MKNKCMECEHSFPVGNKGHTCLNLDIVPMSPLFIPYNKKMECRYFKRKEIKNGK